MIPNPMLLTAKPRDLLHLMRLDKPIGTLLLLWPTLWALWIAAEGVPALHLLIIFVLGTFLTRSAGCVINDVADRNFDGSVLRTESRPLVTGSVSVRDALTLCLLLCLLAFVLVLFTNPMTIGLSFFAVAVSAAYPFMKRHTHWPQLVLGVAFSWGIPMAFSAVSETLPGTLWWLFAANLLWTIAFDTQYAMVDRNDDLKVGIKSTAVLFGRADRGLIALFQLACLACLFAAGQAFSLGLPFWLSLLAVTVLFAYHQWLIRDRERLACFKAFRHNNWVGFCVFIGIALHYAMLPRVVVP